MSRVAVTREIAASVRFVRWNRWRRWECVVCGVRVEDAEQHACWHASLDGTRLRRPDPGMPERNQHTLTVHVGMDGWPL